MLKPVNNFSQVEQAIAIELTHGHDELENESVRSESVGDEGNGGEQTEWSVNGCRDRLHGDHKGVGTETE